MNPKQWFYESSGKQEGPIDWDALMVRLRQGVVTQETRVWSAGHSEWVTLRQVIQTSELPSPLPATSPFEQPQNLPSQRQSVIPETRKSKFGILGWIGSGIAVLLFLLLFMGFLQGFLGKREPRAEHIVKTGHFKTHPEKTVVEAVNAFFGDPKWGSGTGVDGETKGKTLVNAKGRIKYMNKDVEARIQFIVNQEDGTFELHAFELNGIPQNQLMIMELINKMFE